MNRTQVAKAAFAISASSALLAIVLLGAGPLEDKAHPSPVPPWAVEPPRQGDGEPSLQSPLRTSSRPNHQWSARADLETTCPPPATSRPAR